MLFRGYAIMIMKTFLDVPRALEHVIWVVNTVHG
jgi:hypothetical protein